MPAPFDALLSLPISSFRRVRETADRVNRRGWKAVDSAENADLSKSNIFSSIIEHIHDEEGSLRGVDAATEAQGLIITVSGITAVIPTYLIWVALQRSQLARELAAE